MILIKVKQKLEHIRQNLQTGREANCVRNSYELCVLWLVTEVVPFKIIKINCNSIL